MAKILYILTEIRECFLLFGMGCLSLTGKETCAQMVTKWFNEVHLLKAKVALIA